MLRRSIHGVLLVWVVCSPPAWALTDEEIFRDFRFNFINPGARSLALAGAFVSHADDATAAQANPAGLGFLLSSEYFAELRLVDNGAQAAVRGESLATIDTFVATGTDIDDVLSPTFLSAVTKFDRWALGVSRQELINVRNDTLSSFAFTFPASPGAFLVEGAGAIDVAVTNINVGVGVRLNDRLGVGATITYSSLDVKSEVVNLIVDTAGNVAGQVILEPTLDLRTSIDDSDDDMVISLGVIYKRLDRTRYPWGVGAVFREPPRFSVGQRIDPGVDTDNDGTIDQGIDIFGLRNRFGNRFENRFSLPGLIGIGGFFRLSDRTTFSMDIERIFYSDLLDGFVAGVNVLTSADATFAIDDVTDYRLGGEYVVFNENNFLPAMALRAGLFTEGPSTIRALSTGSASFATEEIFAGRDRELHGTMGVGMTFGRYTVDVGADFSETSNEYLFSVIYKSQK